LKTLANFPEVRHVIAQFHDRNNALDLIVHFIPAEPFQPLMVIVQKVRVWVLLPKLFADVAINRVVDEHHDVLAPGMCFA
jgi:hypothetical protein